MEWRLYWTDLRDQQSKNSEQFSENSRTVSSQPLNIQQDAVSRQNASRKC